MHLYWLGLIVFIVAWILTWGLQRFAQHFNLLDVPNERSAHMIPTPRGAGVATVLSFLVTLAYLNHVGIVDASITVVLFISGLSVAVLGLLDDMYSVSPGVRIVVHFFAAIFAISYLGGMPSFVIAGFIIPHGMSLNFFAVIYLVWLLNLYNFMDGIDGLAGLEALTVCCSGAFLYWLHGNFIFMELPLVLAAAVGGFFCWNFPRARIFLGDVGSGFLGLALGVLSIQAAGVANQLFLSWLILLGVFIVDATVTLLQRCLQGAKIYQGHRSHAYQHAASRYSSHMRVSLAVLTINILWLLPLAATVALGYIDGLIGLIIAYLPLVILAIKFNAGKVEPVALS